MNSYLFKGSEEGHEIFIYLDKMEYAQLEQYKKYNLKFVRKEEIAGEIVRWSPFLAILEEDNRRVRFRCPICGCTACERENPHHADPYFWQGNYQCSKCGAKKFNYLSDAFQKESKKERQLNLFE